MDAVIDLTLLLQGLETLQEYLCFGTTHSVERLGKSVERIFIIGTGSNRHLQMVNGFVRFPKKKQIAAQQKLRIRVAGFQCYQMIEGLDGTLNIAYFFFNLGKQVESLHIVRLQPASSIEFCPRFLEAIQIEQNSSFAEMGSSGTRVQPYRFGELIYSSRQIKSISRQGRTEVQMRDRGVGLNLCHLLKDLNGFVTAAKFGQDHSQRIVGIEILRGTAEPVSNLLFGLGVLAFSGQHEAEVYVRRGIIWPALNRCAK